VFISAAFIPVAYMADFLQVIARNNPVTYWCSLARYLSIGEVAVVDPNTGVPMYSFEELVVKSALWIVLLLAIFIPLSIRLYRKLT
jgi:hypothetical protein